MFACISRGVNVIPMVFKELQNFRLSKNFLLLKGSALFHSFSYFDF